MKTDLEKEFQYYIDHQRELVDKYNGRVIVIKNCAVIGDYDSEEAAVKETAKQHAIGTFLVQKCTPGDEEYTQTYNSRIIYV